MDAHLRAGTIGAVSGLVSSFALFAAVTNNPAVVLLGCLIGAAYWLAFNSMPEGYVGGCMRAAALGTPLWAVLSIIIFPLLTGAGPQWTHDAMHQRLPALAGWILYGASLGLLTETISALAVRRFGLVSVVRRTEV